MRRIAQKTIEVGENTFDEPASTRVIGRRGLGEEGEQVSRLLDGFGPPGRGKRQEHLLQRVLARLERRLIGLDADAQPAQFGRFLGRHAAVLVEVDRSIRHRVRIPLSTAAARRA